LGAYDDRGLALAQISLHGNTNDSERTRSLAALDRWKRKPWELLS
jgi:hypothetical protein